MAYSLETSSVKTIVPGAEVSGFADVVARQKITALSGEVPKLSAGEGIDISTVDGKTVITNNISAGENISLVYDMESNTYRIDGQGGNPFPMVSSDDSTLQYKFIYELDGTASGIEVSYTNSGQYAPDWVSSTLVSPTEIKSVISSDGGYTATGFSLTPNGVSASGGWPLPRYRSWTDLTKPTIQWSDAAPDVASVYGSGALLNLGRNNLSAVLSNSGLFVGAATGYNFSGVYINGKGVSSKNAFGLYTYNQYASWEQILSAATGSRGHTYTGIAPVVVNNNDNTIAVTNYDLSAGPNMDIFPSGGYIVFSANGGSELPSAISAWEFTTYSQLYYETYTHDAHIYSASFKALSSQYGGTPTSYPILEFNEQINRSNTSSVNNSKLSHEGIWVRSGTVLTEGDYSEIDYNDRTYVKPNLLQLNFTNLYENGVSANGTSASWSSIINSTFPITGTNGTTGFTANMNCSSMYLSTGAGPAGAIVHFDTKGVHFEAYPSTDVSASWFNLITQYNNVTCSAVKLTTAASEHWFYTSALPNLNEITFIAPSYGPYQTYSALIDDGETTFVAEVDSGCCIKVVRNWNDDRGKNCWCGLNQETYFYIG